MSTSQIIVAQYDQVYQAIVFKLQFVGDIVRALYMTDESYSLGSRMSNCMLVDDG